MTAAVVPVTTSQPAVAVSTSGNANVVLGGPVTASSAVPAPALSGGLTAAVLAATTAQPAVSVTTSGNASVVLGGPVTASCGVPGSGGAAGRGGGPGYGHRQRLPAAPCALWQPHRHCAGGQRQRARSRSLGRPQRRCAGGHQFPARGQRHHDRRRHRDTGLPPWPSWRYPRAIRLHRHRDAGQLGGHRACHRVGVLLHHRHRGHGTAGRGRRCNGRQERGHGFMR